METLVTPRLVLRFPRAEDRDCCLEGMNDLSVVGWLSTPPYPFAGSDFADFIEAAATPGVTWAPTADSASCGLVSARLDPVAQPYAQ